MSKCIYQQMALSEIALTESSTLSKFLVFTGLQLSCLLLKLIPSIIFGH